MDEIFKYDPLVTGVKGLVIIGDQVLLYRRDDKTNLEPLKIDVPGGGAEGKESPFEVFKREVSEEFGIKLNEENMTYAKRYAGTIHKDKFVYFVVAKLPPEAQKDIIFGDEGLEYMLMPLNEYLGRKDAWAMFQERAADYMASLDKE